MGYPDLWDAGRKRPTTSKKIAANPGKTGEALIAETFKSNVWQTMEDIFKNSPMML